MTNENINSMGDNLTVEKKKGKPRGRKTHQIKQAFDAVTTTPVPLKTLAEKFGISEKVLRQANRFDKENVAAGKGKVRVTQYMWKNDKKQNKDLYIYRETNASSSEE